MTIWMIWNVCCPHSWIPNAIVFRLVFGTCTFNNNKNIMPKSSLSQNIQVNLGCKEKCQSSFLSTNKKKKILRGA